MQQPEKHLALTLPDPPWQMIAVFANAMMSAQADQAYRRRSRRAQVTQRNCYEP